MRKLMTPLLAASMLMPAIATAQDEGYRAHRTDGDRSSERGANVDRSPDDRPHRAERVQRIDRAGGGDRAVRMERAERPIRIERSEPAVRAEGVEQPARIRRAERPAEVERVDRPIRIGRGTSAVQVVEPVTQAEFVPSIGNIVDGPLVTAREQGLRRDRRHYGDSSWSGNRDGSQDGDRRWDGKRDGDGRWHGDRDRNHRWSSDWRRDHRYDWRDYRSRYSSIYRLGRYHDPYGWGYRRFSIGLNLWPSYYGSNFWLDDPWRYRLPPAYGPYRWVRYFDDALLVNIHTGQVVDVINNFFW